MPTSNIFIAGFNGHQQLQDDSPIDVTSFRNAAQLQNARVLFAGWSTTVCVHSTGVQSLGHQKLKHTFSDHGLNEHQFYDAFGDHQGMYGCLGTDGALLLVHPLPDDRSSHHITAHLVLATDQDSPQLKNAALAGNGRFAVTFCQAPRGKLCHIVEFETVRQFIAWHADPSADRNKPAKHYMLPGRPQQLCATALNFFLLMEGGEVWSWGDPRHQTLGRGIDGQNRLPADAPALLDNLGGLRITKIACGAWMSAALSRDGALYVWGARPPGAETGISFLEEAGAGEIALVAINSSSSEEQLDVQDVAVGEGHLAVVTGDRRLFVVGENSNGQLGLSQSHGMLQDWHKVKGLADCHGVTCGPKTTLVHCETIDTSRPV